MTFKGFHISARRTRIFTVGAVIALSEPICAQTVPPRTPSPTSVAPAVSAEPNITTASFGDWTLRCQRFGNDGKVAQVCEVAETIRIQGRTTPVAQVAIGRMASTDALQATVVLPTAISFPSLVQISVEKDAAPLELDWRRCLPGGCFADGGLKDDEISRWRAQTQPGRITFKDANGREIAIPLSFRGLAPALDALLREKKPQP